jgi:hypothetical protein
MALHVRKVVFALSLIATAAFADSADISIRLVTSGSPTRPGVLSTVRMVVDNAGPDVAHDVMVTIRLDGQPPPKQTFAPCGGDQCPFGDVEPGKQKMYALQVTLPATAGTSTWTASIAASTPDPNPQNNSATADIVRSTNPAVSATVNGPDWIDPGAPFTETLGIYSDRFAIAHNVIASVELPEGVEIVALPTFCSTPVPTRIDCGVGQVGESPFEQTQFPLQLRAPRRLDGETLTLTATVQMAEPNFSDGTHSANIFLSRSVAVTTTADSGSGSLRAAVAAVNASCLTFDDRCAIVFDIEEPSAQPWKTIRLASPLPQLLAPALHVDGATQTGLAGGGNPDGPSIEISGGGSADGDGFIITSCRQTIANLAINGFRRYGIVAVPQRCNETFGFTVLAPITGNFIGIDPTGTTAVPNLRGIATSGNPHVLISGNVISGNVRSGIFAVGGQLKIEGNRIGLAAHADTPLPNGASGIYVSGAVQQLAFANIHHNVIAFNHDFGIATDRNVLWAGGSQNRIWGNGGLAVDDGMDGPSPSVQSSDGRATTPVITSATYDPATGQTTIRGNASAPNQFDVSSAVEIFASDAPGLFGFGDAQRFVGRTPPGDFELKVNGDLRGQWVAATAIITDAYTEIIDARHRMTELGRAVQVQ